VRPATYRTWILPSSHRLGFLHLIIHVTHVRGWMMLIRCCFATTVMVDTISSASSRSSLNFSLAINIVHHVLLQHLDSYSDHATLFRAQVWGGIHENFILASSYALYIYVCACISFWLINLYLWLALVFLFSRIYYGFTPLRHRTSQHYTSWQLLCPYMASYMMASYRHAHVRF
jgi:hypothetical protein